MDTKSASVTRHRGSCHCGTVQFEAELDASFGTRCNCTVCTKIGQLGTMVKPPAFRLLAGEKELSRYEWGAKIGTRHFCSRCGVHVFGSGHLEQLGGDFVSINLQTLDDIDPAEVRVAYWDGRHNNWEAGPRPTPWPIAA
jgi:hypothetical protein